MKRYTGNKEAEMDKEMMKALEADGAYLRASEYGDVAARVAAKFGLELPPAEAA